MKKLKKLFLTSILFVLCVSMTLGMAGTAFAARDAATLDLFGATVNFQEKVEYGESVDLSEAIDAAVTVTVKGPNGKPVSIVSKAFVANQIGYYTVSYAKGGITYAQHKVLSEITENWVLEVDNNGADIQTIIQKDGDINIPKASAVVYDKEDSTKVVDTAVATVNVLDSSYTDVTSSVTNGKIKATAVGSYFIRYSYKLAAGGEHEITKDFTVKVQNSFSTATSPEVPVVSVSNPSKKGSTNVAYTLPKATATDKFDTNVKVLVTVVDKEGNAVKKAKVDEDYDYAFGVETGADSDVVFDNNKTMKFYPTVEGPYTVTYKAINDLGLESVAHVFTIDVYDQTSPEIEIDETAIPVNTMHKLNNADNIITFPFPKVRDNSQVKNTDGSYKTDGLTVEFSIRDTKADKEVIKFSNILLDNPTANPNDISTGNKITEKTLTFAKTGLVFNFDNDFVYGDRNTTYAVTYKAIDAKNNTETLLYNISFSDSFVDDDAPEIKWETVPDYFVVDNDEFSTFTVPKVSILDDNDIERMPNSITLTINSVDYTVKAGDEIEFKESVKLNKASDGSEATVSMTGVTEVKFTLNAKDFSGRQATAKVYTVNVVSRESNQKFTMVSNSIIDATSGKKAGETVKIFDKLVIAGLAGVALDNMSYTGFEISVTHESGAIVDTSVEATFATVNDVARSIVKDTIVLENCTFRADRSGKYTVVVKAFDFGGSTAIRMFNVEVAANNDGTVWSSDSTNIAINSKFSVDKHTLTVNGVEANVALLISGPQYSLMGGTELVSKKAGSYNISYHQSGNVSGIGQHQVSFDSSNKEVPSIKLAGSLNMYYSKATTSIVLPDAAVTSKGGVVSKEVTTGVFRDYNIEILDKNNNTVSKTYNSTTEMFSFVPSVDGKYTISYKVVGNSGEPSSITYTISYGDIVSPEFNVATVKSTFKLNAEFQFEKVTGITEDVSKLTFKKTLTFPDKTTKTIEGKDANGVYRDKQDEGSKYVLSQEGDYTVTYEVIDEAGNPTKQVFTFTVTSGTDNSGTPMVALTTALIIVAVILLIGVGVYVWFRPVKEDKR